MPLLANLVIENFQPARDMSPETIWRILDRGAPGGPDNWFSMAAGVLLQPLCGRPG